MRVLLAALLLVILAAPATAADPEPGDVEGQSWYLALGDSLAAGYQPVAIQGHAARAAGVQG